MSIPTCPVCEKPLLMLHTLGNPVEVWCGYGPCPSVAANEGAKGSSPEEARKQLCLLVERELEQNKEVE